MSLRTLLLAGLFVFLAGCAVDESANPDFLGQMHIHQVFVLKQDVFIYDEDRGRPWFDPDDSTLYLRRPSEPGWYRGKLRLPTIAEFKAKPEPVEICGILQKGTVLTLDHISYTDAIDSKITKYMFRSIDGERYGREFELSGLMQEREDFAPGSGDALTRHLPYCYGLDPEFLQPVP